MPRPQPIASTLITTFGLGHLRPASGTWGSLPPVAWAGLLLLVAGLAPSVGGSVWWVYHVSLWSVLLVFSWATVAGADRAEAVFGHDPSEVVADETAGQCIPLLLIPPALIGAGWWQALMALALAFLLFRAFDIAKVWPANALQRVPGGWGILLDDLVAGLYAAGGLWVARLVLV
ncbi:MAG: phosphatidylglycerophosphatase A [Phycisphaerales bacterium]|nr:phosphatidylglycerophosphatase A [Phycisphaerales bacterium]